MIFRSLSIVAALGLVIGLPFALKPKDDLLMQGDDTVVIISPHNEAIRYEFTRAFAEHYRQKTGRTVSIDWRLIGGTSEIARYLNSEFAAADQRAGDDLEDTGIGIDLFFGGGAFDFIQQAKAGHLVDSTVIERHPEWFTEDSIPQTVSGEPYYSPDGTWIGACLSAFGICYNSDSLERLGFDRIPSAWSDLGDPSLFKQVALADPTKSGSATKAFEMLIQQQMQENVAAGDGQASEHDEAALARGWERGFQLIQRASANARYFTDSAGKVPVDVAQGDAAMGMCIDFYGRFQAEAIEVEGGSNRMHYFTPVGGSSIGVDPIGLLRGAPNREVAIAFIEFVLSIEGQKLWNFKVDTPGGPVRYALRRLPVRKELYSPEFRQYRSDPDVMPYEEAKSFTYHASWTGPLFGAIRFLVRVSCIDPHNELTAAWQAIIRAGFPPEAVAKFNDVQAISYSTAKTSIRETLRSDDPLAEVQLAKELAGHFRQQYLEARAFAEEGR